MNPSRRAESLAMIAVASIGCALVIAAACAARAWLDRHFLPSYWTPHEEIVRQGMIVRAAAAVIGALIVLVSRKQAASSRASRCTR